jgi:hypothetical protein
VAAHGAIAEGVILKAGFELADHKAQAGPSVISLGLQPDVRARRIFCPDKALASPRTDAGDVSAGAVGGMRRAKGSRKAHGQAVQPRNLSQLFPEIGAALSGGYRVACAQARGGSRALLSTVDARGQGYCGCCASPHRRWQTTTG